MRGRENTDRLGLDMPSRPYGVKVRRDSTYRAWNRGGARRSIEFSLVIRGTVLQVKIRPRLETP